MIAADKNTARYIKIAESVAFQPNLSGNEIPCHHKKSRNYFSKHIIKCNFFHKKPHQKLIQQKTDDTQYGKQKQFFSLLVLGEFAVENKAHAGNVIE